MKKTNKRLELSRRRPLGETKARHFLGSLAAASSAAREELIFHTLTYDEARQLCHLAGIKQIKGNCRKVLNRRIVRLTTVDKQGRLAEVLNVNEA
jgi:hypothetical protein